MTNDNMFRTTHVYGSPFTETTVKEGADGTRTVVTRPIANRNTVTPLSTTKFLKACDMAEKGEPQEGIARALGYGTGANLRYALKKDMAMYSKYREAFRRGEEARVRNIIELQKKGRANSPKVQAWNNRKKDKTVAYSKAKLTAAKNKGMTVEQFREWQRENLARARAAKKEKNSKITKPVQEQPVKVEPKPEPKPEPKKDTVEINITPSTIAKMEKTILNKMKSDTSKARVQNYFIFAVATSILIIAISILIGALK